MLGAGGALAAIPVVGWIAMAAMFTKTLVDAGWGIDAMDSRANTVDAIFAGGTGIDSGFVQKLLEKIGLGSKTASFFSGTAVMSWLFGRKPPKIVDSGIRGQFGFGGVDGEQFINLKAKGGLFRSSKYSQEIAAITDEMGEFLSGVIESSTDFVTGLANMAGVDIQNILDSVSFDFDITFDEDPEIAKAQMEEFAKGMASDLFESVLGGFSQGAQDYVAQFDGLEMRSEALIAYVNALALLGQTVANFANTGAADAAAQYLSDAAMSSTERLQALGDALLDGFMAFEDTPEGLSEISKLIASRYQGEIEYLVAIDQLVKNIGASIAAQQEDIRTSVEGQKTFSEAMGEARELFRSLATAGSPEELANIVGQIQTLVRTAFGGLDDEGKALNADMLISFLDDVGKIAELQAEKLAQMVIDEGVILREQAAMFAESVGAPLQLNIDATDRVDTSINNQTVVIEDAAIARDLLLRELIDEIRGRTDLESIRT
jgi:hypothetical protein